MELFTLIVVIGILSLIWTFGESILDGIEAAFRAGGLIIGFLLGLALLGSLIFGDLGWGVMEFFSAIFGFMQFS